MYHWPCHIDHWGRVKFTYSIPKDVNKDFLNVNNSSHKVDDINRKPSNSDDFKFPNIPVIVCLFVCVWSHIACFMIANLGLLTRGRPMDRLTLKGGVQKLLMG